MLICPTSSPLLFAASDVVPQHEHTLLVELAIPVHLEAHVLPGTQKTRDSQPPSPPVPSGGTGSRAVGDLKTRSRGGAQSAEWLKSPRLPKARRSSARGRGFAEAIDEGWLHLCARRAVAGLCAVLFFDQLFRSCGSRWRCPSPRWRLAFALIPADSRGLLGRGLPRLQSRRANRERRQPKACAGACARLLHSIDVELPWLCTVAVLALAGTDAGHRRSTAWGGRVRRIALRPHPVCSSPRSPGRIIGCWPCPC